MVQIGRSVYQAEIPGAFCMREFLEYYLLLEMPLNTLTKFPTMDAENNPIQIQIDIFEDDSISDKDLLPDSERLDAFDIVGLKADYIILSPKPGERIHAHNLFIALSYFRIKDIDLAQIKVYLDEIDVSESAEIDSTFLILPAYTIMPGIHTVRVKVTNVVGQKYNDISWSFTILPGRVQSDGAIKKQSSRIRANYNGGKVSSLTHPVRKIIFVCFSCANDVMMQIIPSNNIADSRNFKDFCFLSIKPIIE